jgi:hypothetical protein
MGDIIMVTGLFAALFALAQIVLSLRIVKLRKRHKVSLGDGGVAELQAMMRVHGNFTETVPMALILIAIAEFSGAPFWMLYALGVLMLVSRAAHAYGLLTPPGYGRGRFVGMVLTFTVYALGSAICIWRFLASL